MKVIIKRPCDQFGEEATIPNTLKALQEAVGGYIETVTLCSDLVVICDEEGRIKGKPHCCNIGGVDFCGTVILAGVDGDEFADIPCGYGDFKRLFPQLWEIT